MRNDGLSFVVTVDILVLSMGILVSAIGSVFGCGFLVMAVCCGTP